VIEEQHRWRRAIALVLLGLVAVVVGLLAVSEVGTPSSSARTETEAVSAADGVVQTTVSGTGNVAAGTDDDVNFATSGTLEHVDVHESERVRKGQVLATLDPTSAQLTLDEAKATLTAARDTLSDVEDTSSSSTTTTVDEDELAVEEDEQTVKSAEAALSDTTLRAPATGTIASLEDLSAGESVQGGSSASASSSSSSSDSSTGSSSSASSTTSTSASTTSSGSSFAEIVNTNTLTMTVAISEADIGQIKVGESAAVTMDALSGVELAAHVAAISSTATDSDDVVSYDVTLDLDQTDSQVLPGMSASAVVVVDQASGVTVPNDAISGSGSEGAVTLDQDGKRVERQVVVGLRGTSRSVIVSGLSAGEELFVSQTLPSLGSSTTSTTTGSTGGTLGGSSGLAGALGAGGGAALGGGGPP
jgi:membrane fusion protein, macrolide-specific efflux system